METVFYEPTGGGVATAVLDEEEGWWPELAAHGKGAFQALYRTAEGIWLCGTFGPFGVMMLPHRSACYFQITVTEAATWWARKGYGPPPAELIDDLNRHNLGIAQASGIGAQSPVKAEPAPSNKEEAAQTEPEMGPHDVPSCHAPAEAVQHFQVWQIGPLLNDVGWQRDFKDCLRKLARAAREMADGAKLPGFPLLHSLSDLQMAFVVLESQIQRVIDHKDDIDRANTTGVLTFALDQNIYKAFQWAARWRDSSPIMKDGWRQRLATEAEIHSSGIIPTAVDVATIEAIERLVDLAIAAQRPDPGDPPPPDTNAQDGKRRNGPGDAQLLLETTLESLMDKGQYGLTHKEIFKRARISKDSFYRLTGEDRITGEDGPLRKKFEDYLRGSCGKGPVRRESV